MHQLNEVPQSEKSNPTFKISRKRIPWTSSEDKDIISLVNQYGTINWTLIASELNRKYSFSGRSGKQCRERWHNHLDPMIKKEFWTEKEELILLSAHNKYGNKWADIAKHLPGRTDNSIKNYFYSKLRKFLRKIVKEMNQEQLFTKYNIDYEKYNSDKIYQMIRKCNMAYGNINKKEIINLISKHNHRSNNKSNEALVKYKDYPKRVITVVLSNEKDYGYGVIDLTNKIIINDGNVISQCNCEHQTLLTTPNNNSSYSNNNDLIESDTSSIIAFNNECGFSTYSSSVDKSPISAFTKLIFKKYQY